MLFSRALPPLMVLALGATACSAGDPDPALATDVADGGADDSGDDFRTTAPTGELDAVTWYTFYRPPLVLDPVAIGDYPELMITANVCEGLVRMEPDFSIVPNLAAEVSQPDDLTYVYKLRPGITFHDGSPLTAEDVVYSVERQLDGTVFSAVDNVFRYLDAVSATADDEITFTLTSPDALFAKGLATAAGVVVNKAAATADGDAFGTPAGGLVCTGPYMLDSYDPTSEVTLTAYEDYWDTTRTPRIARATFVWPQDPAVIADGMLTGQIDGGWDIPPAALDRLASTDAGELFIGPASQSLQNFSLVVNRRPDSPLADPQVRKALSLAVDRDGMASVLYGGSAVPLYAVAGPSLFGDDPKVGAAYDTLSRPRDIDAAKALVEEAGSPDGTIVLSAPSTDPMGIQFAESVQQAAGEIGLNAELRTLPPEQYAALFFDPAAREGIDAWFSIGFTGVVDPLSMLFEVAYPGGVLNYTGYDNPAITEKLERALGETDDAARSELVAEILLELDDDLPTIPLITPQIRLFQADGLTGAPKTFTYTQTPWLNLMGAS